MKEKSREQELTGEKVVRKITKQSRQRLEKGGESSTGQCRKVGCKVKAERIELKQYQTMT